MTYRIELRPASAWASHRVGRRTWTFSSIFLTPMKPDAFLTGRTSGNTTPTLRPGFSAQIYRQREAKPQVSAVAASGEARQPWVGGGRWPGCDRAGGAD